MVSEFPGKVQPETLLNKQTFLEYVWTLTQFILIILK